MKPTIEDKINGMYATVSTMPVNDNGAGVIDLVDETGKQIGLMSRDFMGPEYNNVDSMVADFSFLEDLPKAVTTPLRAAQIGVELVVDKSEMASPEPKPNPPEQEILYL